MHTGIRLWIGLWIVASILLLVGCGESLEERIAASGKESARIFAYEEGMLEARELLLNAKLALSKEPVCDERRVQWGKTVATLRNEHGQTSIAMTGNFSADDMHANKRREALARELYDYCDAAVFIEKARILIWPYVAASGNRPVPMEQERVALRDMLLKKAGFLQ